MEAIEQWEDRGYTVNVYYDEDPGDGPRDWDNLGQMLCLHSRYCLGDKHDMDADEIKEFVARDDVISLPLYLYDHSQVSISTRSFIGRAHHAEWDSGQVGFIAVEASKVREEFKRKRISRQLYDKVLRILKGEVEVYDQYLQGDVYGYVIERDGEHIDSCWGFYGARPTEEDDYMRKEITGAIDYANAERINELFNQCG